LCGPNRSTLAKQHKKTLCIWLVDSGFATYYCARCDERGFARDPYSSPPDPVKVAKARADAKAHEDEVTAKQLSKARWLWQRSKLTPITGTVAETYLRHRGYRGPLPATLGYLPPWRDYPPSLIAAFGIAHEIEPSVIEIADDAVVGVHIVKLKCDGSDRLREVDLAEDEPAKITLGKNFVAPIVLAPPNDLMALTIGEGIEKVLVPLSHKPESVGRM
jgi:hypothetical protein